MMKLTGQTRACVSLTVQVPEGAAADQAVRIGWQGRVAAAAMAVPPPPPGGAAAQRQAQQARRVPRQAWRPQGLERDPASSEAKASRPQVTAATTTSEVMTMALKTGGCSRFLFDL